MLRDTFSAPQASHSDKNHVQDYCLCASSSLFGFLTALSIRTPQLSFIYRHLKLSAEPPSRYPVVLLRLRSFPLAVYSMPLNFAAVPTSTPQTPFSSRNFASDLPPQCLTESSFPVHLPQTPCSLRGEHLMSKCSLTPDQKECALPHWLRVMQAVGQTAIRSSSLKFGTARACWSTSCLRRRWWRKAVCHPEVESAVFVSLVEGFWEGGVRRRGVRLALIIMSFANSWWR